MDVEGLVDGLTDLKLVTKVDKDRSNDTMELSADEADATRVTEAVETQLFVEGKVCGDNDLETTEGLFIEITLVQFDGDIVVEFTQFAEGSSSPGSANILFRKEELGMKKKKKGSKKKKKSVLEREEETDL